MDVEWNGEKQEVTIQAPDGRTVVITIGKKTAYANGGIVPLDVPAKIVNGRTLVPIRFVSERYGAKVTWDGKAYAVYVETGGPRNVQPLTKEDFIKAWGETGAKTWDNWGIGGLAYLRVTRIYPDFKQGLQMAEQYRKEHPDEINKPNSDPFPRLSLQELLWAYYKGPIPASPYEKEVMSRIAKNMGYESWDKVPKALLTDSFGVIRDWSFDYAILLDYHFNEEGKLDSFIFRPIGQRYAFRVTIKNPIGSYVNNVGWAGFNDEKFNGVLSEIATPEIFEEIKKSGVVIGLYSGTGRATGELNTRFSPPFVVYSDNDFSLKYVEEYRWNNTDYMVKAIRGGGDFQFVVGGYFMEESDLSPGSKILPDYFTKRRSFTPGSEWRPWTKDEAAWIPQTTYQEQRSWYTKSE
ncbi:hypothetical protein CULT_1880008 [[Clostridium] ultunense Esp]|nr:hypothetical protein CULT_1880008 [[Clostridium] ultunense Esp]